MAVAAKKRVELVVHLDKVRRNFLTIRDYVEPAEVMVVLKANAYGLGVVPIARALVEAGARWFGVASLGEALEVRAEHPDARILILGSFLEDEVFGAIEAKIILPVGGLHAARLVNEAAKKLGVEAEVHVLVDTGMGRLGLLWSEAGEAIATIAAMSNLKVDGIYSHLSLAYDPRNAQTERQLERFKTVLASSPSVEKVHLANSDAINNFGKQCHFNMVRTGINLYGLFDLLGYRAYDLSEALELRSVLVEVRTLPEGFGVGYGGTYVLPSELRVGTVSIGYADGLPYAAGNRAKVLVRGRSCPVLGRVSMDYITIGLGDCPEAEVGDEVLLVGRGQQQNISLEYWARVKGSHPYDMVCSLGRRVEKTYLE